jgi:hypothetical protein
LRRIKIQHSCNIDRDEKRRVPGKKSTIVKDDFKLKVESAIFLAVTVNLSRFNRSTLNNTKEMDPSFPRIPTMQ